MQRLSFRTAGESHGRALIAILEGIPAGLSVSMEKDVDPELRRRQGGHGRGRRMQIETDKADLLAGVRLGETLGSPIALVVWNKDSENWTAAMSPFPPEPDSNPITEVHYSFFVSGCIIFGLILNPLMIVIRRFKYLSYRNSGINVIRAGR